MATTTVVQNPFDSQPPTATQPGLISAAIGNVAQGQPAANTNPMTGMGAQTYTAQQRNVDRTTETAAGQLDSILAQDSPLMRRARTIASQNMNQRGLVNSSMAQGAGVAAMIDRATPIAQQDAETYANRALANQSAVNTASQFNAGEANKFGLQRSDQMFTAAENLAGRQFQTSERVAGQAFTADQNKATQDFQAAQAQLDRAQQVSLADKSIEAAQALELARQKFQTAEAALDRANQKALQESQQTFQAAQNQLDRLQQTELQSAAQLFQATEAEKNRAADIMLADKNISAQNALQQAQQEFQRSESVLDRAQQVTLQTAQQNFQSAQNDLDRAQQVALQDKSIAAQQALQTAQQNFESAQNALDRTQQSELANKNITAQQALENARQEFQRGESALDRTAQSTLAQANQDFQATQAQLDRDNQKALVNLQDSINDANVSQSFAASLASGTLNAINAIQGDPNLDATAKRNAIQNVIDTGNATMQWGSSFYNTPLPSMKGPGGAATAAEVAAAYREILGRDPESAAVIQANVDSGQTIAQIRENIARSPEAIQLAAPAGTPGIVNSAIQSQQPATDAWGRTPGDPMYGVDPVDKNENIHRSPSYEYDIYSGGG